MNLFSLRSVLILVLAYVNVMYKGKMNSTKSYLLKVYLKKVYFYSHVIICACSSVVLCIVR